MNYHFLIDHWFADDFIKSAEKIVPGVNTYVLTFDAPSKHVKSQLGISIPYGSSQMDSLLRAITSRDRVYVHWFHESVMELVEKLTPDVPLYLIFWGGDFFISGPRKFFNENHDKLTKAYLIKRERETKQANKNGLILVLKKRISSYVTLQKQVDIRRKFLKRLNYFCHWNKLDFDQVESFYGGHAKFIHFYYGGVLDFVPNQLDVTQTVQCTIWLGNSDTATNNHLDALEVLTKFRDEKMQIICPLSYGFGDYGDMVDAEGKRIFDEKWKPIRKHVPLEHYITLQNQADVVVMYHNRSQASGNIMAFIKMGKKVYLKKQSTLFRLLRNFGIEVFEADNIPKEDFDHFSAPLSEQVKKTNSELISKLFSEEGQFAGYRRILTP